MSHKKHTAWPRYIGPTLKRLKHILFAELDELHK